MLVKKVNPEWRPSENKDLRVGEVIDITDPRTLILNGEVVAVDENGIEKSAYELYGVMVDTEVKDFEEYVKMKKQEALKNQLEKEKAELEKQLEASKASAPVAPAAKELTAEEKAKAEKVAKELAK